MKHCENCLYDFGSPNCIKNLCNSKLTPTQINNILYKNTKHILDKSNELCDLIDKKQSLRTRLGNIFDYFLNTFLEGD